MADPIQPEFTFPGLDNWTSVDFVFNRGVVPSVCLVQMPFVPPTDTQIAPMTLKFGSATLTFSNCSFNRAHIREGIRNGLPTWSVQIFDRRWKWQYGSINGDYNRRLPDGSVTSDDKKNARELATIILQGMGEAGFDVSALPTNVYPRALWKDANPAAKLDELCRSLGCVVVLGFNDAVTICVKGQGADLPDADNLRFTLYPLIPTRRPSGLAAVASDTVWQATFELEAVGCEDDGTTKKLNDLSYKPDTGWPLEWWCAFRNVGDVSRPLAFNYVYRWFRIKGLLGGGWNFPNCPVAVNGLNQLVFEDGILGAPLGLDNEPCLLDEILSGAFWTQGDFTVNSRPFTRYAGGFRFNRKTGIVVTDYPAIYWNVSPGGGGNPDYEPAHLYLTAACRIRRPNGDGFVRHSKQINLNGGGVIEVLRHPELKRTIIQTYNAAGNPVGQTDTQNAVETEMNSYLSFYSNQYTSLTPTDGSYIGLWTTPLDGALSQVQFKMGMKYSMVSRIGRNMEPDVFSRDAVQRYRLDQTDVITGTV